MGNSMKKNKNAATATTTPVSTVPESEPVHPDQKNGIVIRGRKRGRRNKKDRTQKGLSCPAEFGGEVMGNGGATPYTPNNEEAPRVKIKLYRSYADLDKFMQEKLRQSRPDLKVYRRSTGSLERVGRKDKTKSVPSGYDAVDYSRDSGNESAGGSFLMNDSGTPGSEYAQSQWNAVKATANGPTATSTPSNNNTLPPKDGRRSNASSNSQSIPECEY